MSRGSKPLVLLVSVLLLVLSPSSEAFADDWQPHILCTGGPEFCTTVYQMRQRILADPFFAWWIEWADERQVLIERQDDWPPGQWGAWPTMNTIGAAPGITGSVEEMVRLIHEITHMMDYPCNQDPWSHERVYFWQMVALANLREKSAPLPEEFWGLWTIQTGFELRARYFPYGLTEPCREFGIPETAPHGITYTWLKPILGWWD